MPRISAAHLTKMRNSYRLEVAQFLARCALDKKLPYYSDLTKEFGGVDRGWGDVLGGIALRLHEAKLPILSVIVVSKGSDLPSGDAILYEDIGLKTPKDLKDEQERCFQFNWNETLLLKGRP